MWFWQKKGAIELKELEGIAYKVRQVFEIIAEQEDYQPNLMGLCGRASLQLFIESKNRDIKSYMAIGQGHIFNIYNKTIIDTTGTQFGFGNRVIIFPYAKKKHLGPAYNPCKKVDSIEKLFKHSWLNKTDIIRRDRELLVKYLKEDIN